LSITRRYSKAAARLTNKFRNLGVLRANEERGSSGGGYAIELAWNYQPFQFGVQADQVDIRYAYGFGQTLARLIWIKSNIG
jgi:hypothetical protein